jgi:hypothetical protein
VTVILDPGNDPNSWTDAQPRQWRLTAGLWKSQDATDAGNATNWANSSATWQSRANTAYDTGVWGSGNTWQTDYNNQVNTANTYYNNWQAWQGYAHGDSNVWNTRYNQGVSDANAAIPNIDHLTTSGTCTGDGLSHTVATLTADRTGVWIMVCRSSNANLASQRLSMAGIVAGAQVLSQTYVTNGSGNGPQGAFWQGSVSAGQQFRIDLNGDGSGVCTGYLDAYFLPTPSYPH